MTLLIQCPTILSSRFANVITSTTSKHIYNLDFIK